MKDKFEENSAREEEHALAFIGLPKRHDSDKNKEVLHNQLSTTPLAPLCRPSHALLVTFVTDKEATHHRCSPLSLSRTITIYIPLFLLSFISTHCKPH